MGAIRSFVYSELRLFTYPYFCQVMLCRPATRSPDVKDVDRRAGLVKVSQVKLRVSYRAVLFAKVAIDRPQTQRKQQDGQYGIKTPR